MASERTQVTEVDFYLTSPGGERIGFTAVAVQEVMDGLPVVVAVPASLPGGWTAEQTADYFAAAAHKLRGVADAMLRLPTPPTTEEP